jgi:hypothetical protein
MVYPALLPLMRTSRLSVVDSTEAPVDLNGLVRFAERRNLVSARVPSHFKRSRTKFHIHRSKLQTFHHNMEDYMRISMGHQLGLLNSAKSSEKAFIFRVHFPVKV